MRQLAKDIDGFLNEVILQAENQHEILNRVIVLAR